MNRMPQSETQEAESTRFIEIRDLKTFDELCEARALEKEVWQFADEDRFPLTLMIATQQAGSLWLGAFHSGELIGYAFGFLAHHCGQVIVHSHQLAVRASYRNREVAYRLKLAQRDRALAMGIRRITWTFDPLQSKNAHFNFAKLGVLSDSYKENFYGPRTSSLLHKNDTDRLWVTWVLDSRRVEQRLRGKEFGSAVKPTANLTSLVHSDANGYPVRGRLEEASDGNQIHIDVPDHINRIQDLDPVMATEWRSATRWAFIEAMKAGFVAVEFCRSCRDDEGSGTYRLEKCELNRFVDVK
jgi:predicted GNAT superfamily acetyltransferase